MRRKVRSLIDSFPPTNLIIIPTRISGTSRDLAAFVKFTLGLCTVDMSVYHGAEPQNSISARPDVDAVIVILPITKQPEVILRTFAAGKHVSSDKLVAKAPPPISASYDNTFPSTGRRASFCRQPKTSSLTLPIERQDSPSATVGSAGTISFPVPVFVPTSKDNNNTRPIGGPFQT